MARHDYRDPATGEFGKKTVSFPQGSILFPVVQHERTKKKGPPTAFKTTEPDGSGGVLVKQETSQGDNTDAVEKLIYEKLPGPEIWHWQKDDNGSVVTASVTQSFKTGEGDLPDCGSDIDILMPDGTTIDGFVIGSRMTEDTKVKQTRTLICVPAPIAADDQGDFGFTISYPHGDEDYPAVTWRVRLLVDDYVDLVFSQTCAVNGYEGLALTEEEFEVPLSGTIGILNLKYETLPGPVMRSWEPDEVRKVTIFHTEQDISPFLPFKKPLVGDGITVLTQDGNEVQGLVISAKEVELTHRKSQLQIEATTVPNPHYQLQSRGFQFPGIFAILNDAWETDLPTVVQPPWVGVHYNYERPRTKTCKAVVKFSYVASNTKPQLRTTWNVVSPGAASRIFPIEPNTIHPALDRSETHDATTYHVEIFAASTPTSYKKTDELLIEAEAEPWRGNIWVIRETSVREDERFAVNILGDISR